MKKKDPQEETNPVGFLSACQQEQNDNGVDTILMTKKGNNKPQTMNISNDMQ
jgi:hypothetical protein